MNKINKLREVKGLDVKKIKKRSDGRFRIHLGREIAKRENVCEEYSANSERELIEKLYDIFFNEKYTLNQLFERYEVWRLEVGTKSKTLKEDRNEWNSFFRGSTLGNIPISSIQLKDVKKLFLKMTADNSITRTRFNTAKSVLRGVFQYATEEGIITDNIVDKIDNKQFKKRFKPEESIINYSYEEICTILNDLRNSSNIYDYAIRFFFYSILRISEVKAVRYSDIKNKILYIKISLTEEMPAYLGDDGRVCFGKTQTKETVIKGASKSGIRPWPLNDEAIQIVEEVHSLYPNNEYLFENNGNPLKTVTFNRHLQAVCLRHGIEYRPSHKIRFTNCDRLYNEGEVRPRSLQNYMGHTQISMTEHYISRCNSHEDDDDKARACLSYK